MTYNVRRAVRATFEDSRGLVHIGAFAEANGGAELRRRPLCGGTGTTRDSYGRCLECRARSESVSTEGHHRLHYMVVIA